MSRYDDENALTNAGDWTEIVGEQTRGGQDAMMGDGGPSAAEILGELFNRNPAFKQQVAKRVAMSRPVVRNVAPVKARDWAMSFTAYGTVGQTVTVTQQPQVLFRAEKLIVQEIGSSTNGIGSTITSMLVGQKNQLPVGSSGIPAAAFASGALGNGIKFDTCQPALSISFTISFLQTCTWIGTLFGKAVTG